MLAVDLGKDREQVGKSRVGDELFDAIEEITGTPFGKGRGGPGAQRIAATVRFGQTVGGNPLAGGKLFQVLLLLLCRTVIDQGKRTNAGLATGGDGKRTGRPELLRDQHAGGLIQFQATKLFRDIDQEQT